jgi:hypothetical protein
MVGLVGTHGNAAEFFQIEKETLDRTPPFFFHIVDATLSLAPWSLAQLDTTVSIVSLAPAHWRFCPV